MHDRCMCMSHHLLLPETVPVLCCTGSKKSDKHARASFHSSHAVKMTLTTVLV